MSDTKLRELERRWKETGAVEDEAAYLLERVRVGDLTQERLELAAYCGHEGASKAIGSISRLHASEEEWFRGLSVWGKAACVRAAVELARAALDHCSEAVRSDERITEPLKLAENWLRGLATQEQCGAASDTFRSRCNARWPGEPLRRQFVGYDEGVEVDNALTAVGGALAAAGAPEVDDARGHVGQTVAFLSGEFMEQALSNLPPAEAQTVRGTARHQRFVEYARMIRPALARVRTALATWGLAHAQDRGTQA